MITNYKNYIIEVINDSEYIVDSNDNLRNYAKVYTANLSHENCKHGVIVKQNDKIISSALICEIGYSIKILDNSFLISHDSIFICCERKIYSLSIPELNLEWSIRCDFATCFGIYEFEDDLIIHGETEISRLTKDGLIKWQFCGRDIFIRMDGQRELEIIGNTIKLKDFQNFEYILDKDGNEI